MRKRLLLSALLLLTGTLLLNAAPEIPWQEPDAAYRLELTTDHPENCTGFPLGQTLLPGGLAQGVTAYDGKGNRLGYSLKPETGFLLLSPAPGSTQRLVYFGFKHPRPTQNWQKKDGILPGGFTLAMEIIRTRIDYPAVVARFKKRKKLPDPAAFLSYFTARHRRVDVIPTGQVKLDAVPKRYNRFTGITFTGMLKIDHPTDVVVGVDTNSGTLLEIDGRTIFFQFGETPKQGKFAHPVPLRLEAGSHLFRLYYQYNGGIPFLNLGWRLAAEKEFRPLTAAAFSPGWPGEITVLRNSTGQSFPLVKREWVRHLFVSKTEKLSWQRFILPSSCRQAVWRIDGVEAARGNSADLLLKNPETQQIAVTPGNGLASFSAVAGKDYQEEKIVDPQLYLKTFAPLMFCDDEDSEFTLEADSGIPGLVYADLVLQSADPGPFGPGGQQMLVLGQAQMEQDHFAPANLWKQSWTLPAATLQQLKTAPLQTSWTLKMGGRTFDTRTVVIAPLAALSDLRAGDDGFTNTAGALVIPVLHRPSLAERRTWTLPRQIEAALTAPRRLLIVTACRNLTPLPTDANTAVSFLYWPDADSSELKTLLQTFIAIREQLAHQSADGIIIMPPTLRQWAWLPPATVPLLLSGLLETAVHNPAVHTILLTTPLPDASPTVEARWNDAIKRLARDYDLPLLDLNARLKISPRPDFSSAWQQLLLSY